MHAIKEILSQTLMITGFVMIMMLLLEYLNVLTRGNWDHVIAKWKIGQSFLCSFLGVTPGCLGAYAAGSLYIHRVISGGALTAAMIATCGDEAFVMLALFPKTAIYIFSALFVGGVITGVLVDLLTKHSRHNIGEEHEEHKTSHPDNPRCTPFSTAEFVSQWRNCSPQRGWLTLFLALYLGGILIGAIEHNHDDFHSDCNHIDETVKVEHVAHDSSTCQGDHLHSEVTSPVPNVDHALNHEDHESHAAHADGHGNWVQITFIIMSIIALGIVATVPDHFLDEHLWRHLVKVHGWRILLWTLGSLTVTYALVNSLDVSAMVANNKLPILLTACLVGVLPASGPNLIFVTLYSQQALPLSVLVANCIVQDGHGMIPTLAHSRKTFVYIKALKLAIGFAIGLLGHAMGW